MAEVPHVLAHSVMVTAFVFGMMLIVDYVNVLSRGKMSTVMRGGVWQQYALSSFLGAVPGCLGAFMNVSFYVRGLLSFGAIVGGMIATSGDEAYVMLALFPKTALFLFGILFVLGIVLAWVTDRIVPILKIVPCQECRLAPLHLDDEECQCFDAAVWKRFPRVSLSRAVLLGIIVLLIVAMGVGFLGDSESGWARTSLFAVLLVAIAIVATVPDHYLREHILSHIVREHLWRVFLWTLFALLFVHIGLQYWNLEAFVKTHMVWVFLISALVGLIPESGPHLVFVTMFASGIVPFSVLLTSSLVQDGHGMLPLLSYSVKDSIQIKLFNLAFGLAIGGIVHVFSS